ncbi:MAG: prepilin-type N-terminal cleavage/methylation domain-containing protein, partial [Planctomycetes bacterium]|nr:prepilin-type N-terminal cleavage/methylation domain-containing protein [Planctomycetota bacterium]
MRTSTRRTRRRRPSRSFRAVTRRRPSFPWMSPRPVTIYPSHRSPDPFVIIPGGSAMKSMRREGFTLIELLVVIAIIA